jgi:hypothetical protein
VKIVTKIAENNKASRISNKLVVIFILVMNRAWGGVVVKALRY